MFRNDEEVNIRFALFDGVKYDNLPYPRPQLDASAANEQDSAMFLLGVCRRFLNIPRCQFQEDRDAYSPFREETHKRGLDFVHRGQVLPVTRSKTQLLPHDALILNAKLY